MNNTIHGLGHDRIIPEALLANKISHTIFSNNLDTALAPNIALADAEFADNLVYGDTVVFMRRDTIDPSLLQSVQTNEDPEADTVSLCAEEVKICNKKQFRIKLSVDQYRHLMHEQLDSAYFETVEKTISDTLDLVWDESHLAHMIVQAYAGNTGNNAAGGLANLGSPDNPIVIPAGRAAGAEKMEETIAALQLILTTHNAMSFNGDTALILPAKAANAAQPILRDLNTCCGEDNIRIKGQLSNTLYGFDTFQTNRQVLSFIHNGKRLYYLIAADKHASGFVTDVYNFKWYEREQDWMLVGTEVHGSYVVQPKHIAIACITFQ